MDGSGRERLGSHWKSLAIRRAWMKVHKSSMQLMLYLQDRSTLHCSLHCVRNRKPLPHQSGHYLQHNMLVGVSGIQLLLSAMLTVP